MSEYNQEVQKMRDNHLMSTRNPSRLHTTMLTNAIKIANGKNMPWFFINVVLCDDVLKIAEKDYHVTYYTRVSETWGRYGQRHVYKIATRNDADSMRLHLRGATQIPESYFDGMEE
jgi:hypothetical protein